MPLETELAEKRFLCCPEKKKHYYKEDGGVKGGEWGDPNLFESNLTKPENSLDSLVPGPDFFNTGKGSNECWRAETSLGRRQTKLGTSSPRFFQT